MRSSLLRPLSASREIFAQRRSIYEMMIKKINKRRSEEKEIGKKEVFSNEIRNNDINRAAQWKNDSSVFFPMSG